MKRENFSHVGAVECLQYSGAIQAVPRLSSEGWEDPVGSSGGDEWPQDLGVRVGNVWAKGQACREEAGCLRGEGLRPAGVLAFPASSLS